MENDKIPVQEARHFLINNSIVIPPYTGRDS